jgi:hypothetical protein
MHTYVDATHIHTHTYLLVNQVQVLARGAAVGQLFLP